MYGHRRRIYHRQRQQLFHSALAEKSCGQKSIGLVTVYCRYIYTEAIHIYPLSPRRIPPIALDIIARIL